MMNTKTKFITSIVLAVLVPIFIGAGVYYLLKLLRDNLFVTADISDYFCEISALVVFAISLFMAIMIAVRRLMHDIIHPVITIKNELKKISDGDLKNEISNQGSFEIKELTEQLEILRLNLLESIHIRNQYEENRNFLLSSISHDLKTPVTSVKGYIQGVLDGVANTPEKIEKYLWTAISKTDQMNFMIDDLLLYSKLDLKQIPFQCEKTAVYAYISQLTADCTMVFHSSQKEITLISELPDDIHVFIDKERFKRAFQNVVDNAKKHIEPHTGRLEVRLREVGAAVLIDFKDNGYGIKEEALKHIFERFYKADGSRTSGEGNGLGLAIAKEIVKGHNGRIWAVNNADNKGASIKISLKKV